MNRILPFIIAPILVLLLTNCNIIQSSKEYVYLYDTVRVAMNDDVLEEVYAGERVAKTIVFTNSGQSTTFKQGEPIELIFDGVDMSKNSLDVKHNKATGEIILSVVNNLKTKVILTEKCEVIERRNTSTLPMIEVAEGLNPEQIIITPIFDSNCNQLGYQIRYGSEERGCRKVAKPILERFTNCAKKIERNNKINVKKTKNPMTENKQDCPEWILFGLPCK